MLSSLLSSLSLPDPSFLSSPGTPKKCIILLHGLGSNGKNFLELGHLWKNHLPSTLFLAPNAPFSWEGNEFSATKGYQWFGFDTHSSSYIEKGIQKALPFLSTYVDNILKAFNFVPRDIVFVGFSQGAMMSLAFGLQCRPDIGGVLAYSGGIFGSFTPPKVAPPLCIIHGQEDTVVPPSLFFETTNFLKQHHLPFESHLLPSLSHTISERGIELGAEFLKSCLK